jgi:hypothetical protein
MALFTVIPYNRENAVAYARRFALRRNPIFDDYTGIGGDCTNFVSQSVYAGTCVMNSTPEFGWYYVSPEDRAPAWSSVEFFYDFITGAPSFSAENGGTGPFGREVRAAQTQIGDVVQLARGGDFYHTLLITGYEPRDILVSAQSDDALDRRLTTYNFDSLRFIHIDGVHIEISDDDCFTALNEGISLP